MFSTFDTDPLTANKQAAVYALVRHGLDIYSGYLEGVRWTGGAGQHQGAWHPMVFLGALTTNGTIRNNVRAATAGMGTHAQSGDVQFIELYQVRENVNGIPIWGSAPGADGCADGGHSGTGRYWSDYTHRVLRGNSDWQKGTCGDPYGYIDGPAEEPGNRYAQCCSTGTYVGIALAMHIWPEFNYIANNQVFRDFADRVMDDAGWWATGDPCAIYDPRESSSCNPYGGRTCSYFGTTWGHNSSTGNCITISEATAAGHPSPGPRWPEAERHLKGRPTLYRGNPGVNLWDALSVSK